MRALSSVPELGTRPDISPDTEKFTKRLINILRAQLAYERIKPELIKIYDESFTTEELTGINAFYRSPAGQAYLAKVPLMTQKSMQIGLKLVSDAMPEIQKATVAWMDEMKKKYGPDAK